MGGSPHPRTRAYRLTDVSLLPSIRSETRSPRRMRAGCAWKPLLPYLKKTCKGDTSARAAHTWSTAISPMLTTKEVLICRSFMERTGIEPVTSGLQSQPEEGQEETRYPGTA
jgi:hypothetical protein